MPTKELINNALVFAKNKNLSEEDAMIGRVSCLFTKEKYEKEGSEVAVYANADYLDIDGRMFVVKGTRPNHKYLILKDIDLNQNAEGYFLNEVNSNAGYSVRPLGYISHEKLMRIGTRGGHGINLPLKGKFSIPLSEGCIACRISDMDSFEKAKIGVLAA